MPRPGRSRRWWPALAVALAVVAGPLGSLEVVSADTAGADGPRLVRGAPPTFADVPPSHPFAEDVAWAARAGLVEGYADSTFGPTAPLSRQAAAALLHRLAGRPVAEGAPVGRFGDVGDGHPFVTAIAWMAATGVAEGYPDGTFRPGEPVSRQAMAAFLHRTAGPDGVLAARAEGEDFDDVGTGHPFHDEIAWMAAAGVAEGYADGTFRPAAPVTRQAAVAFLHRAVQAGLVPDPAAEPEWFEGPVEDFYVVPEPLPPGRPGQLVRLQEVAGAPVGTTTLRIMYHSRDAQGRDRAVTGTLSYPDAPAPPGGWPVLSTANGTVGLASHCALSRNRTSAPTRGLPVVAVASDYIGLGPVGERHPYLSRLSEGRSVIDAVRAARDLPEAGAGTRWWAIGGSQGGHGALSASELGEAYAPELDLLGTVAYAPAAMFDRNYGALDVLVTRVVTLMALYGAATELPEIDPRDYVHPDVAAAVEPALDRGCLPDIIASLGPVLASEDFWAGGHPKDTEPARSLMLASDVGTVAVDAPVLVVQGTADTTVFPERTRDLVARMCGAGQVTAYLEVDGADHGWFGPEAEAHVDAWLLDRLAGGTPPDDCPA